MGKSIQINNHNAITARDFESMLRLQLNALWEGTCPADKLPPLNGLGGAGAGQIQHHPRVGAGVRRRFF